MTGSAARLFAFLAAVHAVAPYRELPAAQAFSHGMAAVRACARSRDVTPRDVIRIARRESRFQPEVAPHGRTWPERAEDFPYRTKYACGVMQVVQFAGDHPTRADRLDAARRCVALRPLDAGYRAGVATLQAWYDYCRSIRRKGARLRRCALAGYGHGGKAARRAR